MGETRKKKTRSKSLEKVKEKTVTFVCMCVCALFNEMLRLSALHAFTRRKPNTKSSLVTATPPLLKREKKRQIC